MARTSNKTADTSADKAEGAASPDLNFNNSTRAEQEELNKTVDTETGEVIKDATGSGKDGNDDATSEGRANTTPPGTDRSVAELIKVKTTGDFLFHDPYTNMTVDNSDDGGNKDGIVKTALVQNALDDGRLEEI